MVIIASQTKSPNADSIEGLLVTTAGLDTSEGGMGVAAAGSHTDRPFQLSYNSEIVLCKSPTND